MDKTQVTRGWTLIKKNTHWKSFVYLIAIRWSKDSSILSRTLVATAERVLKEAYTHGSFAGFDLISALSPANIDSPSPAMDRALSGVFAVRMQKSQDKEVGTNLRDRQSLYGCLLCFLATDVKRLTSYRLWREWPSWYSKPCARCKTVPRNISREDRLVLPGSLKFGIPTRFCNRYCMLF